MTRVPVVACGCRGQVAKRCKETMTATEYSNGAMVPHDLRNGQCKGLKTLGKTRQIVSDILT